SFSGTGGLLTTMAAVGNAHPRSFPDGACNAKAAVENTTKNIPIQFFMSASSTRIVILGEVILHLLFVIPCLWMLVILRGNSMSGCECKPDARRKRDSAQAQDRAQPSRKRNHHVESTFVSPNCKWRRVCSATGWNSRSAVGDSSGFRAPSGGGGGRRDVLARDPVCLHVGPHDDQSE